MGFTILSCRPLQHLKDHQGNKIKAYPIIIMLFCWTCHDKPWAIAACYWVKQHPTMTIKCLTYIIHLKEYHECLCMCGCEFEICLGPVHLIWCQYLDTVEDIPTKHVFEPNRASYQRQVSRIHSSYTETFSGTSDTTTASYCSQKDLLTHQNRCTGTTYWLTGLYSTGTVLSVQR